MKNILFIHQSSELYGSDKTLLYLVIGLKTKGHHPIVVLPNEGPLMELLLKEGVDVVVSPVFKISRKMFGFKNLLFLPHQIIKAFAVLDKINSQNRIDIVYSNTLAVLIGILYAWRRKIKHIWHVHEIIESPKPVVKFFKTLLARESNGTIIYNSAATKEFWNHNNPKLNKKSVVVLNGMSHLAIHLTETDKLNIRKNLFGAKDNELVVALVGRISRWKGQLLLLEAFRNLLEKHPNTRLVYVGSPPPDQEVFLENLKHKIAEYRLQSKVTLVPFQEEIAKVWEAIDIAVVPSTEPEPFGLVALEAMLASKPVIGANHGGLKEIILDQETGFLFEPCSVKALEKSLSILLSQEKIRLSMGLSGFKRATSVFSLENYVTQIEAICQK